MVSKRDLRKTEYPVSYSQFITGFGLKAPNERSAILADLALPGKRLRAVQSHSVSGLPSARIDESLARVLPWSSPRVCVTCEVKPREMLQERIDKSRQASCPANNSRQGSQPTLCMMRWWRGFHFERQSGGGER